MRFAHEIVQNQRSRGIDKFGSGQFGARRGKRSHSGLDIKANPGEPIFAPFPGSIVREARPYANDASLTGMVLRGSGAWQGYEVKVFYAEALFSGHAAAGMRIGHAQDLTSKYPGITNHIHLEVRRDGSVLSPQEVYGMCF